MLTLDKRRDSGKEEKHGKALNPLLSKTKNKKPVGLFVAVKNYYLKVTICGTEGIDPPSVYPHDRNYQVILWVDPEHRYVTEKGISFPILINIRLGKTLKSMCLSVEVVRERSGCEPGSSTGIEVVGRAKIPLPNVLGTKQDQRTGLVRIVKGETVGEGHIITNMQLSCNFY